MNAPPPQAELIAAKIRQGVMLQQQGRLDAAKGIYSQLLLEHPDQFEAQFCLGLLLHQQGNSADAVQLMDKAIRLRPNVAGLHSNHGDALQSLDRLDEALESYDRAIALKPDHAAALFNRGLVLRNLQRLPEALASFDKALAIQPHYAEACYHRGVVCEDLNQPGEALKSYDRALAIRPDFGEAFYNRGLLHQSLGRPDQALADYARATALKPDCAEAFYNQAALLKTLNRPGEALESYDRAIALKPDDADALSNRGIVLRDLKRLDAALQSFDGALAIQPDYAGARLNKSTVELLMGDMSRGWRDFESRKALPAPDAIRSFAQPEWLGEGSLENKTILIYYELHLGDTIKFCRYLPKLEAASVLFAPQKPLRKIMEGLGPRVKIVDIDDPSLTFDCHCPLLSLPFAFGTTEATIPADTPYLFAEPERVRRWDETLGKGGFKIGVNWQASATSTGLERSFPLAALSSLARIPGVRLISLHKGEGAAQLDDLPGGMTVETLGPAFDAGDGAFLDTAAVMKCCDLIISPDTATAHLAGALGAPAWVALKYVPHWYWMLDRPNSPWYPTMRLFRQKADGDWAGVLREIEAALIEEMGKRTPRP